MGYKSNMSIKIEVKHALLCLTNGPIMIIGIFEIWAYKEYVNVLHILGKTCCWFWVKFYHGTNIELGAFLALLVEIAQTARFITEPNEHAHGDCSCSFS